MYALDPDDFRAPRRRCLAIVGSREFPDLELLTTFVRSLEEGVQVVSGGARGVDRIAARVARALRLEVEEVWPRIVDHTDRAHIAIALLERNVEIVQASTEVVAFWDGTSTGTLHAVTHAVRARRRTRVYLPRSTFGRRPSAADHLARELEAEDLATSIADRYVDAGPGRRGYLARATRSR